MPEQPRHLANKYEDIVNLQGAEAYCGGRRLQYQSVTDRRTELGQICHNNIALCMH